MPVKNTLKFSFLLLLLLGVSCGLQTTSTPINIQSTETPTVEPPTATTIPLAAKVNGEGIWLDEYQASFAQLKAAAAADEVEYSDEQMRQMVLDDLVAQTLLAQKAVQDGFTLDQPGLDAKIEAMSAKMGGMDALQSWIAQNGYTEAGFRQSLQKNLAAEFEKTLIISGVGETADQVHARQILVTDESLAGRIENSLVGVDFATVAFQYDPLTGGDLGWFPRGYLTQPAVEEAAFSLQPGQYSKVIKSVLGYHIVYVIERDASHPLTADARSVLKHAALRNWVSAERAASTIEILIP